MSAIRSNVYVNIIQFTDKTSKLLNIWRIIANCVVAHKKNGIYLRLEKIKIHTWHMLISV